MPVLRLPEHILFKVPQRLVKPPTHQPHLASCRPAATKRQPSFSPHAREGLTALSLHPTIPPAVHSLGTLQHWRPLPTTPVRITQLTSGE
jgi:hypothetical protein